MALFDLFSTPAGVGVATILAIFLGLAFLVISNGRKRPSSTGKGTGSPVIHVKTNGHVVQESVVSPPSKRGLILYGTQTGTAERFAKSLRSQLERRYGGEGGWKFVAMDTEVYSAPEQLSKEKFVLLLMATYGDGEPTDSAVEFYDWAVEKAESGDDPALLENLNYGVFALGNRQYESFCAVGQRLHGVLTDLGAQSLLECGLGDDDVDIDADFDSWTVSLMDVLDKSGVLGAVAEKDQDASAVDAFTVTIVEEDDGQKRLSNGVRRTSLSLDETFKAAIVEVKELHSPASSRSCLHVELDLMGSGLQYAPGDHVAVRPRNSDAVVEAAAKALGYDLQQVVLFGPSPSGEAPPFEHAISVRDALALGADLLGPPSKAGLATLAAFSSDSAQASRLRALAAPEGMDDYHSYIVSAKRSLLEVLQEYTSAKPPLGAFFASVADKLQPRYYSISSSLRAVPERLSITCVVVEEWMPSGRLHRGVASNYLAALNPSIDRVPISIRRSTFRLPSDAKHTPIVMVGPGTGLAPFRGFLQERQAMLGAGEGPLAPATLFFGCRREDTDFIYRDELEAFVLSGALTTLHVAFSRKSATKDYVQHHLRRHAAAVWEALGPVGNGSLYICGDAAGMARDVNATLCEIAMRALKTNRVGGEGWLREITAQGRVHRDIW